MSLWEYKAITSGKGGFATPALLESYLNQLGTDEWEIIEFRTQPENILAFSGLARRPTQRDWTLEAAVAAAARVEADKLRAEFAAKFQAASSPSSTAASAAKDDSGNPNRDDSFRRPRDTDSDLDPYALDDSSPEAEDVPSEDELPTFFEAVRPHMRRNQKGPGYSVGLEYIIKKFDMMEEDLAAALVEIGFEIPEDEDDKPVYIEYDGDIYWLNVNRRGEVWINTREKPRAVFKTTKATRLTPEAPQAEQPEAADTQPHGRDEREVRSDSRENRRNDNRNDSRNDSRNRRNDQRSDPRPEQRTEQRVAPQPEVPASSDTPTEADLSAETSVSTDVVASPEALPTPSKPQREPGVVAALPTGLDLLERVRPMMRRSRGGWSGTISYLSRALRHSDEELVAAFGTIGLIAPGTAGDKAPIVECGPFAYWLNKDGRGGVWINAREARRLRQEQKAQANADAANAEITSGDAPESAPSTEPNDQISAVDAPNENSTLSSEQLATDVVASPVACSLPVKASPAFDEAADASSPASASASVSATQALLDPVSDQGGLPEALLSQASGSLPPSDELAGRIVESAVASDEPTGSKPALPPLPSTLPLAGVRLLLKELRPGSFSGELCFLAEKLSKNPEEFLNILLATGLKSPDKPREKSVFVEHAGEVFWLNRNAKGELWINAKASKYSRKDEDSDLEQPLEASSDSETVSEEKKPRRIARPRKKAD